MTHLPRRDIIATSAVAAAVVLYLLWLAEAAPPGLDGTRATGLTVLALGFVASATAVVPSFDQLIHGSRWYLAVTSLLGVAALVAGIIMLWTASTVALAVLTAALVTLWAISTTHHAMLARSMHATAHADTAPRVGAGRHAGVR